MTQATEYASRYNNSNDLVNALVKDEIDADQDWENEKTTWTFEDGSSIEVSGIEVSVK